MTLAKKSAFATVLLVLAGTPALAHTGLGHSASFTSGFLHPFLGLDHMLAMTVLGVWAALAGGAALWLAPVSFVVAMGCGFALALAGLPLPYVEPAIATSVVVFGLLAALALRLPALAVVGLSALFALFHGHAHGAEMGESGALAYGIGFILATIVLHGLGMVLCLGLERLGGRSRGRIAGQMIGGATALAGLALALA